MTRRSFVMTYERKGKSPNNFGEHSFSATNISISKFIDICMALSITAMLHLSILLIIFTLMISTKKVPTFNWFFRLRAWSNWMLLMYLQRKIVSFRVAIIWMWRINVILYICLYERDTQRLKGEVKYMHTMVTSNGNVVELNVTSKQNSKWAWKLHWFL